MRHLPLADPGRPDLRSPGRFLLWVARGQAATMMAGAAFGITWMATQAALPALVGAAVDDGVAQQDTGALLGWFAAMAGLGGVTAYTGIMRHRFAVTNWLTAAYRTQQLVARQAVRTGETLTRRLGTGEVVAVGATDVQAMGNAMEVTARASGAVVSFVLVALLLLSRSVPLGLVVLIGVPLLMLVIGPLLRPLHRRQAEQRARLGTLSTLGADTVTGLRVLRGVGGEDSFVARYRAQSQRVRDAGVRVARVQSVLDAAQVLLPGVFVVTVTWMGARFAIEGTLSVGDLVAFYGYAAFLMVPLRTLTEYADRLTRGLVASRRILAVLDVDPDLEEPAEPRTPPPLGVPLTDEASGLRVEPGCLTALVSAAPEETAAIADRLGRHADAPDGHAVRLDDVPLDSLPLDAVRQRVLVHDADPRLFSGVLRREVDPTGQASDARVDDAIRVASAEDVLDALPHGLASDVEERGRSFSGGQRQRLALTRSLLAEAEVLVLVEPTSAVDAHTEARIADRLREHRSGRTTVLVSTSPLLLDRADRVVLVEGGRAVAHGTHRALLERADYRAVVIRGEADGDAARPSAEREQLRKESA
ncbi:MAG: ABC transporter ATP-binding protein [Actinomycetes bacterium]